MNPVRNSDSSETMKDILKQVTYRESTVSSKNKLSLSVSNGMETLLKNKIINMGALLGENQSVSYF